MNRRFAILISISLGLLCTLGFLVASASRLPTERAASSRLRSSKKGRAAAQQTPPAQAGRSATLLPDGRWLLIGGEGEGGPSGAVSIWEQRTGTASLLRNGLHQARAWHSATMLPDGTVFIFGGVGPQGQTLNSAELFNPATGSFELLASSSLTARSRHTATLLTDGHVLIVGGVSDGGKASAEVELWNTQTRRGTTLPARLQTARRGHEAKLLPNGNVLVWGGERGEGGEVRGGEQYDLESSSFVFASEDLAQDSFDAPLLAASLPKNGETGVPKESRLALRFSKPLLAESLSDQTLTLSGPEGKVLVTIVPAERGRLIFVTPQQPLLPETTYTLSLDGPVDETNLPLAPVSFSFTTVGTQEHEHEPAHDHQPANLLDDESWIPGPENMKSNWRSERPDSDWRKLAPLQAAPGVTALAGQVLKLNGQPLANVTVQIGERATRTDSTGRFLLTEIDAGPQEILYNGYTASTPGHLYAMCENGVSIAPGLTNILPYTVWLPAIDTRHSTSIPVPTTREVVATNPVMPGLEVHIPAGVRLLTHHGTYLSNLTLTPIPADRAPFPVPEGTQFLFTPQGHGAQVQSVDGRPTVGIRITYPNLTRLPAGTGVTLWDHNAEKGWYAYGKGTVTRDGKQIVPDAGVGLQRLNCIGITLDGPPPPTDGPTPDGGEMVDDPVDLGTGLFVYSKTDLRLPDVMKLELTRTYRQNDTVSRAFGIGATHSYNIYLVGDPNATYADLILPNGGRVRYNRTSAGTGPTGAVMEHTGSQSVYYKSKLTYLDTHWYIKFTNGTVYDFQGTTGIFASPLICLRSVRDRLGNQLTITRDYEGKITRMTSPNNRWLEFTYDASDRITLVKDNIGRTVGYTYDASGRLWKVTDPGNGVTEYSYDAAHRMTTIKDARQILYLTNEYDANGRVIKQTQADNSFFLFNYTLNASGKVAQTDYTDARGNVRRVVFNSDGYSVTDIYGLGKPEQQTYTYERQPGTNLILSSTDNLGRKVAYTYTASGNLASVTNLAGTAQALTATFTYEPTFNQVETITDPLNHVTRTSYDAQGNATSITDALNHQTTFTYNAAGQVLTVTDPLQHTIQYTYDAGDLSEIRDPLGYTIKRFHDGAGRVVSQTDQLGQITRYEYDKMNHVTKVTDALQGTTAFDYDANGNLLHVTDARSKVTGYTYNSMDRLETRTDALQGATSVERYEYDAGGNLTKLTDRRGKVTTYSYDSLNRVTSTQYGVGTASQSSTSYIFDGANRLTSVTDSLTGTIGYGYDSYDRLTSETTPLGSVGYAYDNGGRRQSMTVLGQPAVTYGYDDGNRLTSITQGAASVLFQYDEANRRTVMTLPNGVAATYSYDSASELMGITYEKGAVLVGNLTYEYDPAGRRTKMGGSLARVAYPQAFSSATYNAANQLTQKGTTTFSYDANGNLTADGVNTYTWNDRNQLAAISGGVAATFTYDAFGRRINKSINGQATGYLYDGAGAVQELSGTSPTANLLTGGVDEVFSRSDAAGTRALLTDALGSTVALTDSNGAMQTQYSYDAFGAGAATGALSSNASQYTGRENDGTGLYFNRARYYSPALQRFISEDPIGFAAGDANLYAYVGNDPVNSIDPSGLQSERRWVELGDGWRGGIDRFPSGERFEIHVYRPNGDEAGIVSGRLGWIGKHGNAGVRPGGVPEGVMDTLNGVNVDMLRRTGGMGPKGTENIRGGRYLNPGRSFYGVAALQILSIVPVIIEEHQAWEELEARAGKHGLTPQEQFFLDSERLGHPQFYMTPIGPMPNPHYLGQNNPFNKA